MGKKKTKYEKLRKKARDLAKTYEETTRDLGSVLFEVRSKEAYKAWGHDSFVGYCEDELNLQWRHAYRHIRVETFRQKYPLYADFPEGKINLLIPHENYRDFASLVNMAKEVSVAKLRLYIKELEKERRLSEDDLDFCSVTLSVRWSIREEMRAKISAIKEFREYVHDGDAVMEALRFFFDNKLSDDQRVAPKAKKIWSGIAPKKDFVVRDPLYVALRKEATEAGRFFQDIT